MARGRVGESGEFLEVTADALRSLIAKDAELSDVFMRAFIHRRVALIASGMGSVIILRSRHSANTLRLGALAAAREHLGSLDRVARVVRLGVFIATSGDFFDQPHVADAASDLFRDVFGADNMAVRLVIGVASLPLGMPIELEVIFEVAG
jgi:enamine deaminase RidA (YjgF/YER057c/UK114 family)